MAIYFIEMTEFDLMKIGYTDRDPMDRLKELQTANPHKLELRLVMAGDAKKESQIHLFFSHLRTNGEWFKYTAELQTYVALARFVFPRMVEMEDRIEKCRNQLDALSEAVERLQGQVGGTGDEDEPTAWMIEINRLREELASV